MQNKKFNSLSLLAVAFTISLFVVGCSKDPANPSNPGNESETITTFKLRLVQEDDTTRIFEAQWRDLDGEGPNPPTITGFSLHANKSFKGAVKVLDETKNPVDDLTEEIEKEDEAHQFFYIVSGANLTIEYDDEDSNGKPVGLEIMATTDASSSGTLRVILKHEATKNTTISVPPTDEDTDLDIVLPVRIQ
ncbi:MAG: type 1 periplasmic binding fold superfamily protein [Chloroherpetonaceae bacterium]